MQQWSHTSAPLLADETCHTHRPKGWKCRASGQSLEMKECVRCFLLWMFVFLLVTKVLLPNLFLTIRLRTISSTFTAFKCCIHTINDRRLLLLLQGGSVSCEHNLVNPLKIGENAHTVSFSAESFRGMEKLVSEIFIQLLLLAGSYAQFQICTSAQKSFDA